MTGGRLAYAHNFVALEEHQVESLEPIPPGRHQVAFHFERTGEHRGIGHLTVDGHETARLEIPRFTLTRFSLTGAGLTCGYSDGLPVTRRYAAPLRHGRPVTLRLAPERMPTPVGRAGRR
jgi:arylsulfatase